MDLHLPGAEPHLVDLIAATVDDYRPFAVDTPSGDECPSEDRLRQRIFFFSPADRQRAAEAITSLYADARGVDVVPVDVVDDAAIWAERTQAATRAVRVGRLVVAPPWDVPPPEAETACIVIRPSMGFGTGQHATTRLCLAALQTHLATGMTVTDLGTGSGVLAIAAAKLGARHVLAVDHDDDALGCAWENVGANAVDRVVTVEKADLESAPAARPADVVVANLTGALIRRLSTRLRESAVPGAWSS